MWAEFGYDKEKLASTVESNKYMSSAAKKVIEKIESEGHIMLVGPKKGKVLVDVVKDKKPKRILEIGTYVGYSAILMAEAVGANTKIVTIEVDPENAEIARENIKKAGFEDRVEIKVGYAKELIPTLSATFDFMFIDAAKEDYLDYLKLAEGNLQNGAVVVADNVKIFKEDMLDFLEYVRESGKYKSTTHDVGSDALEVSIKK